MCRAQSRACRVSIRQGWRPQLLCPYNCPGAIPGLRAGPGVSEGLCGEAAVPSQARMPGLGHGSHSLVLPPPPDSLLCAGHCSSFLGLPDLSRCFSFPLGPVQPCVSGGEGPGGTREKETETEKGPREAFLTK